MLLTTVSYSGAVCVLCAASVRVCAEEVGGGSLFNLKGKYKAHTKLGVQAGRQGSRKGKARRGEERRGKAVGIC